MTFGSAADGLLAAITAGGFSLITLLLTNRRSGRRRQSDYQKAVNELRRAYEQQIEYLKGQITALQDGRRGDAREIARLNKLLNQQQRRGPTPGGGAHD